MDDSLTKEVIGAAIEVHKELGPGLLESVYRKCLALELRQRKLDVQEEMELPLQYKGKRIESSFRLDLLINKTLIVELKTVERVLPVHNAQIISYLKMGNKPKGLLINFNVPVLKQGIKRFVNSSALTQ